MVRFSMALFKNEGLGINKTLQEILVCPLSKQPLRLCEKTNSLISDAIGVSYPIVDGIPHLVPKDGKLIETNDELNGIGVEINDSSDVKREQQNNTGA